MLTFFKTPDNIRIDEAFRQERNKRAWKKEEKVREVS